MFDPHYFSFQVGDKLPSVDLFEGTPGGKVNIAELGKGKKILIFGVPGAFTPGCSKVRIEFTKWNDFLGLISNI